MVMDHRSLEWLQKMKGDNSRLTGWSLNLQPYQFEVQYRSGKMNRGNPIHNTCIPVNNRMK